MDAVGGHERIDRRSLAMHQAIAEKLRADPSLLAIARDNLARWSKTAGRSQHYLDRWREILDRPLEEVLALMVEESERNDRHAAGQPVRRHPDAARALGDLRPVRGAKIMTRTKGHVERNMARNPSCSKCRSLVRTSVIPSRRIACIEMQSVRL